MDQHPEAWQRSQTAVRLLIASALFWLALRCATVTSRDGLTPFLSANDRSRWCTVVALVEQGKWEIDDVILQKGWDTIDKVYHPGDDGEGHYYSSKPTLYPWLVSWAYRALRAATGWNLSEQPFLVGRILIFTINGSFLLLLFTSMGRIVRRHGETTWGIIFSMAVTTWGNFLPTFGVTINNHLPAAAAIAWALDHALAIWFEGRTAMRHFFAIGLGTAFAASCELPALALLACLAMGFVIFWPRPMLLAWAPPVAIIAAAFFFTNWDAHHSFRPAYAHRAEGSDWDGDNWYNYPGSYWLTENRRGVDQGEPSRWRYGFHVMVGHHGIFSLSPVWLMSAVGLGFWSERRGGLAVSLLVLMQTVILLTFYIALRDQGDRNYGGVCTGFRWAFWLIPLYLLALIPTADWIGRTGGGKKVAYALLAISTVSAAVSALHPWQHPWPYRMIGKP